MPGSKSERSEYSVLEKAQEEGNKLLYDTTKHLTTLCTGSLLLLVTFLEKLFSSPLWKPLVAAAFVCLFLSLISSVVTMLAIGDRVYQASDQDKDAERTLLFGGGASLIGFLLGVLCLVAFALRNFFV